MIPQKMSKDMWQELKDYVRATLGSPEGSVVCRQVLKEMEVAEKRWRPLQSRYITVYHCPECLSYSGDTFIVISKGQFPEEETVECRKYGWMGKWSECDQVRRRMKCSNKWHLFS